MSPDSSVQLIGILIIAQSTGGVTIHCDAGGCLSKPHRRGVACLWTEGPTHLERHLFGTKFLISTSGMYALAFKFS